MTFYLVCSFVCLFVTPSRHLVRVGQQLDLRYADKRILNTMKVCIERNNWQVEFDSVIFLNFIHVSFAKRRIKCSIAERKSGGTNTNHFVFVSDSLGRLAVLHFVRFCHTVAQLRYADKLIVNNEMGATEPPTLWHRACWQINETWDTLESAMCV